MEQNGVSILISSYNGASRLEETMYALSVLDISNIPFVELILVDNASTDNSLIVAQNTWEKFGAPFDLRCLVEHKKGKFHAQDKGILAAKGSVIIICDDDNLLFPDYLQIGFSYFKNYPSLGVVGAKGIPKAEVELPIWFEQYSYHFACGKQAKVTGNVFPGRNVVYGAGMWFRKDLYMKAKELGFNFMCNFSHTDSKSFLNGGEDSELCWAIRFQNFEIWFVDELCFYHNLPKARLEENYLNHLKSRINSNGPYSSIYSRVWNSDWNQNVRFYWIKEIIYSFIYLFKINLFSKIENKKFEVKRTFKNISFYLSERSKFDLRINHLIEYKRNCKK
jgi:glycosyltransferase involved in cell wall biosynthesis